MVVSQWNTYVVHTCVCAFEQQLYYHKIHFHKKERLTNVLRTSRI